MHFVYHLIVHVRNEAVPHLYNIFTWIAHLSVQRAATRISTQQKHYIIPIFYFVAKQ